MKLKLKIILILCTILLNRVYAQTLNDSKEKLEGRLDTIDAEFLLEFDLTRYYSYSDIRIQGRYLLNKEIHIDSLYSKSLYLYFVEGGEMIGLDSILIKKINQNIDLHNYIKTFKNIQEERAKNDYRKAGLGGYNANIPILNYFCNAFYTPIKAKMVVMYLGKQIVKVPIVKQNCNDLIEIEKQLKKGALKEVLIPIYAIIKYLDFKTDCR